MPVLNITICFFYLKPMPQKDFKLFRVFLYISEVTAWILVPILFLVMLTSAVLG